MLTGRGGVRIIAHAALYCTACPAKSTLPALSTCLHQRGFSRNSRPEGCLSMSTSILGVIPARLESSRFPGKALHRFRGKPLLYYVWRAMSRSKLIGRLVIATDNPAIREAAMSFGAEVVMTGKGHRTGSDRAAEVARGTRARLVVNIQGDNLGLKAGPVDRAITLLQERREFDCTTLAKPVERDSDLSDPNLVKLIANERGRVLWFSRFPLPYLQKAGRGAKVKQFKYLGHIGVYVYRRKTLEAFAAHGRSPLETAESLEQLRVLEHGWRMGLVRTRAKTVSVDTPDDIGKLSRVRSI